VISQGRKKPKYPQKSAELYHTCKLFLTKA